MQNKNGIFIILMCMNTHTSIFLSIYSYKQQFNLDFIFYTLGDIFTTLYPLYF